MTTSLIRIKTEGFRAIGSADIVINGITVVAGENGCGKSTISKLLYYLYKTAANFDLLVYKRLKIKLRDVEQFLDILQHDLYNVSKDRLLREELRKELMQLRRLSQKPIDVLWSDWRNLIQKMADLYNEQSELSSEDNKLLGRNVRSNRLRYIMKDILKLDSLDDTKEGPLPFERITELVDSIFKESLGMVRSRPTSLFTEELRNVFSDGDIPKVFDVMEFEEPIVALSKQSLSLPYLIQNVVYIDTPMIIGIEDSENNHWNDLNELLSKTGKASFTELSQTISEDIIHGDVSLDESNVFLSKDFSYKRDDGSVFNLLDCATGVKSFAILQLLLKNGSLSDKTLLIIDEPESHLHPQWIIEYARLIVLLNKKMGIKFFIASHNPDMVSAIKYIYEKESQEKEIIESGLNFYLAKKYPNKYSYNYELLRTDIDPIFESFNIAITRINQYGS
jgi:predicted ATP-dependent endonuclease of OLD family